MSLIDEIGKLYESYNASWLRIHQLMEKEDKEKKAVLFTGAKAYKQMMEIFKEEFEKQMPKQRIVKGYRGCRTYGHINLDDIKACDNPECTNCASWKEALKEEAEKWASKILDENKEHNKEMAKDIFLHGRAADHIDKNGKVTKLSQEEIDALILKYPII